MPSPTPHVPGLHTTVLAVHCDSTHRFSKQSAEQITLVQGLGVQGDAHCGATVQHRSRVRADPSQPNLRQVHLVSASLWDHVRPMGFSVQPGQLGENISLADAAGLNWRALIDLPVHTQLHFSQGPVVQLTGLRNPCAQIEAFQPGLLAAMLGKTPDGRLLRKTGVMAIVLRGGAVQAGDRVQVHVPPQPHQAMDRV